MFAGILEAIIAFLKAIPLFAKYFPPRTPAEDASKGEAAIVDEIKRGEDSGRPGA